MPEMHPIPRCELTRVECLRKVKSARRYLQHFGFTVTSHQGQMMSLMWMCGPNFFEFRAFRTILDDPTLRPAQKVDAGRRQLQRVSEIARRKVAASTLRARMIARRDAIMKKYEGCNDAIRRRVRDEELRDLYGRGNLPAEGTGSFRNADGSPAPMGEGIFVPDPNNPTGPDIADALERHGAFGIPYSNGRPDLSGFPPPGSAGPDGRAWSVEIEQSLTGNRKADTDTSWGAWRDQYGADHWDPRRGPWHHSGDGATMQYVDQDIHGSLSHIGDNTINQSPEF